MRIRSVMYASFAIFAFLFARAGAAQNAAVGLFPANRAVRVNPDTHLVLTFLSAPTLGKTGQIRIYDARPSTNL